MLIKLEWLGYRIVKKDYDHMCWAVFICYRNVTDRQNCYINIVRQCAECWRAIKIKIWPHQKAQNDGVRCHLLWQTCCAFGQCAICQIITALLVRFHSRLTCSSTNTVRCWRQLCPARSSVNASWLLPSPTYLLLFNFYQVLLCLLIPLTSYFASLRCKQLIKVFSNNNCCCALY